MDGETRYNKSQSESVSVLSCSRLEDGHIGTRHEKEQGVGGGGSGASG